MGSKGKETVIEIRIFGRGGKKKRDAVDLKPLEQNTEVSIFSNAQQPIKARTIKKEKNIIVEGKRKTVQTPVVKLEFPNTVLAIDEYGNIIEKGQEDLEPRESVSVQPFMASNKDWYKFAEPPSIPNSRLTHFQMTVEQLIERATELGMIEKLPDEVLERAAEAGIKDESRAQPEPQGSQSQNVVVYPEP